MIGLIDSRLRPELEFVAPFTFDASQPGLVGISSTFKIYAVRWRVLPGVDGEGLLLLPNGAEPIADIVALPECDWTPEMLVGLTPGVPRRAHSKGNTTGREESCCRLPAWPGGRAAGCCRS